MSCNHVCICHNSRLYSASKHLSSVKGVVINFILHCNRCDANEIRVASLRRPEITNFLAKFTFKRRSPPTICALLDRPVNALHVTLPLTVSHKETL